MSQTNAEFEREQMVDRQIARRGVRDGAVLDAMRAVPREAFVEQGFEEFAYQDAPLPISEGQTISQPYIVALMIELAGVRPGDNVLEVGAGSGYAAAVLSRLARYVHSVERHPVLGQTAQERLAQLGYDNVKITVGDGTLGLPNAAPFDAILVAAGGPEVPRALKDQLAVGGRLVVPVGLTERPQKLLRLTRVGEEEWDEEEMAAVNFVPLIGAQGWSENDRSGSTNPGPASIRTLPEIIAAAGEPLPDLDDPRLGSLFDRFADRRVVLLGEASHGTSEFYRARAAISRHLVEHHGFTILAAEADWPDAAAVDRYVRNLPSRARETRPFQRFPEWMWKNVEFAGLVEWLRRHNDSVAPERQAAFRGLDMYNMKSSIAAVLDYLETVDPEAATTARERYGCLTPWQRDPSTYGRAMLTNGYRKCEEAVVDQCRDLLARELDYAASDGDAFLDAAQNARLIASAERYYRVMYYGGAKSWNLRDSHMFETLGHLLDAGGPDAKAVVWAHNSHIGDARHTEMGAVRGEHNIGQLCRERWGEAAALIGFGTHTGTVAAATDWGGRVEVKGVYPSHEGSFERLFHDSGIPHLLLDLSRDAALSRRLAEERLQRFIGVIYRPETELASHYANASLSRQYDAFVWFDETTAVTPLGPEHRQEGVAETYPFGL